MANNQIKIGVGFQVNKTDLENLISSLRQIQFSAESLKGTNKLTNSLKESAKAADQLENILNQSWNNKLNQLDLNKVNQGIKNTYGNVKNLKQELEKSGTVGSRAYNDIASAILTTNMQLRTSNKLLDEMAVSMANTVKWGITSSIFNNITNSITEAFHYTKRLDSSLNDIRIVTDKSAESMEKFARQANEAAKGLGASTLDYTEASLIYYQQGLEEEDVAARAETTLKAANVTGQYAEEVSEQLTAVWNGYKVSAQEAELYIDKLAAVATGTASDLEELSTGMSKVASAANSMGVDIDQLNAQLATIVSVTRQAPESVGTALKTIYARMSDLKMGGTDEEGLGLGEVSGTMEAMGIQVLDATGNLREIGDVIEEVAAKWDTWTEAQKTAMAQVMAGKRQYNNLVALFENWDMYTDALNMSANAAGTLQEQQEIYLESTAAHLQQLRTEAEKTYDILFDQDTVNGFTDVLKGTLGIFNNFIEGLGGGTNAFIYFGSVVGRIFSKQITEGILKAKENFDALKANAGNAELKEQIIANDISKINKQSGININDNDAAYQAQLEAAKKIFDVRKGLTQEEYNETIEITKQIGKVQQELTLLKKKKELTQTTQDYLKKLNIDSSTASADDIDYLQNKKIKGLQQEAEHYKNIRFLLEKNNAEERKNLINNKEYQDALRFAQKNNILDEGQINDLKQKGLLTNKQINQALQENNNQYNETKQKINAILELIRKIDPELEQQIENNKELLSILNAQNDQYEEQARKRMDTQKIVTGAMAAAQTITALTGAIDVFSDSASTGEQKAHALGSAFGNIASVILPLIPGLGAWGIVLGALAPAITNLIASLDFVEDAFKSNTEKLEELNKQQEEYINKTKEFTNSKKSLEEVADEYERLSEKAGEYDENIDSLTESERKRYNELKNSILQYNKDALLGYNAEGEAILKKNQGIQETIDLLKEEYNQKVKNQFIETWKDTTEKRQDIIDDAQKKSSLASSMVTDFENQSGLQYQNQLENFNLNKGSISNIISQDSGLAEGDKNLLQRYIANNNFDEAIALVEKSAAISKKSILNLLEATKKSDPNIVLEQLKEQEEKAILELQSVQKLDGQLISNTIKYIEDYNTGWTELESLEIKGADTFLNKFIDSLEYSEDFGYDEAYVAADKYAQNLAKVLKSIQEQGLDPEKYLSDLKVNPHDFDTIKEYQQAVKDKIVELLEDPAYDTMSNDEKGQFFTATFGIDIVFNDDGTFEADAEKYKEKIRDFWNRTRLDGGDLAVVGQGISQTELEKVLGPEYIDRLSEIEGLLDKNTIATQGWIVALQNAKAELDKIDAQNAIVNIGDNVDNLTNSFLAGDVTSENIEENKDFQAINNQIDELIEKYPELTAAAETFKNTHLVGTQLWTEALGMLQDKINEVKLDKLKDEYDKVKKEIFTDDDGNEISIDAFLESDTFEADLENLLNADYAINVEIHAQAEQAFEQTQAAMNNIEEQASKIGDNFIVAAEDIRELNNAFPGIISGLTDLKNGTVQLNKEVVQSAMESAKVEIAADSQATNEKLKNAADELIAKQKIYQGMADSARALAEGAVKNEEARALHEQKIEEGLATLDEMATQSEMDNDKLVAESSNINAEDVAKNWNQAYQEAAESAYEFGQVAAQAHLAAKTGDASGLTKGNFDVNYAGSSGQSLQAIQLEKQQQLFEKYEDSEAYAIMAQEYQEIADSLGKQANDILGMMAENGASVIKTSKTFSDIAKGKGSDGSSDRNKEEKKIKDEIDRYWELNKAIENVEESLSDLDKKQDKLYGRELIDSLKQENQLLAQQADRYQALAAAQRQEASELQGLLSSYGVVFDAQGGVANYLAATQTALERYNQAVAAYNAGIIDEATFETTEKAYDNFKSTLERYETLYYQEMIDTQNKLDDIHRQELENNLQAWEVEIQLKLDTKELERQWNDFFADINNNFKLLYEDLDAKMSNLTKQATTYQGGDGDIATTIAAIRDVTAEIDKMNSGGESGMFESVSQAQEKLKELNEQLQDSALAMRELWEEAWDTYLEGIDQAADKFDDLMDKYDNINEEIEYQKELIELLYGDEAYQLMGKYYEAQERNTKAEIDSLKQQADLWKKQYEQALAIDEANGTMSEDTQKFYELWQDAQQGLNDKVVEYIELLQNDYKNTITGIIDDLEKAITGGSSLDDIKEEWELLKKQSEMYYDDVEKIYQLSTLAGKYENSIANTSNIKNQQKLQEMYDKEMEYLQNKKFLSEYDLDVANAKYDMTLKQIMLEEAQQNKNAMKLTRGTDGNWTYQYVADEDDIANKQQDLLDAANQYYQITKDGYHENLEDMMSAQEEYLEKLQEINEKYMNDEEMRAEKAQELYETYYGENGILTLLYIANEEKRTNMADATLQSILNFYAIDEENYALMTEAEKALIDGLKDGTITNYDEMLDKAVQVCEDTLDSWESSAQGIADAWFADNGVSVKAEMLQAYKELEKANQNYQKAVNILEKSVQQDFGPEGIGGALDSAKNKTEELDNKTAELCSNAESNLDKYRKAINNIGNAWESVKSQIQGAIDLLRRYLEMVGVANTTSVENISPNSNIGSNNNNSSNNSGSNSNSSNSSNSGSNSSYQGFPSYWQKSRDNGYYVAIDSVGDLVYKTNSTADMIRRYPGLRYIDVRSTQFNTGGYTGSWNNGDTDGRLAWLHQKELILNSSDTANILNAVDTVRDIANLGTSINNSIMNGISQMVLSLMNLGNYGKGYNLATAEGRQESVFNINANFPNANDVESIREAIMSLPNLASQYIARNRK